MRHPMRARTEATRGSQSGFSLIEVIIVVIIVMVMAAMAAKWMGPAIASYRLSGTAHEIAAAAQLARIKATTSDARFRVFPNTGARTYRMEFKTRTGSWTLDPLSADYPLPTGVNFDTTGGSTTSTAADAFFVRRWEVSTTGLPAGLKLIRVRVERTGTVTGVSPESIVGAYKSDEQSPTSTV